LLQKFDFERRRFILQTKTDFADWKLNIFGENYKISSKDTTENW